MFLKKEVDLAIKSYNQLNHLNLISNQELPSSEDRKLLWYRLISRRIKRKIKNN